MTAHAAVAAITILALAVVGMCWLRRGRESQPQTEARKNARIAAEIERWRNGK